MEVVIRDEEMMTDVIYSSDYAYMMKIEPPEASFYTAIGYSLLMQLARVAPNFRKQTIGNIERYLKDGVHQKVNPALNDEASRLFPILNSISNGIEVQTLKSLLRNQPSVICSSFQVILAEIFTKSHKTAEASGILQREPVIPENKYYFQNFVESLSIRIVMGNFGASETIYVHQKIEDKINIGIYVSSINPPAFAIMIHEKEVLYDRTLNKSLVGALPFLRKQNVSEREGEKKPLNFPMPGPPNPSAFTKPIYSDNAPGFMNKVYQLPESVSQNFPNAGYSNPTSQNFPNMGYPNPVSQNLPNVGSSNPVKQNPENQKYASSLNDSNLEEFMIGKLCEIFLGSNLLTTSKESRQLKSFMKKLKKMNPNLNTEAFKKLREDLSACCKSNHDPSEFVIFKSCKKRHCKQCLKTSNSPMLICDCRCVVDQSDCRFHLSNFITSLCVICDQPTEANDKVIQGKNFHVRCLSQIQAN